MRYKYLYNWRSLWNSILSARWLISTQLLVFIGQCCNILIVQYKGLDIVFSDCLSHEINENNNNDNYYNDNTCNNNNNNNTTTNNNNNKIKIIMIITFFR